MSLHNPPNLPSVLHFAEALMLAGPKTLRRLFAPDKSPGALAPRKALVINGHPDPRPERYCAALARACAEGSRAAGWQAEELVLGGLAGMEEAPDGELLSAFRKFNNAEYITLVFPLWLNEPPALLSGFLKQAAEEEDAVYPTRARKFRVVVTMDMPAFAHRSAIRTSKCRLSLAGIVPDETVFIGSVGLISLDKRADWLRILREAVQAPSPR